ncbi:hypothetical protein CNR22_00200 [Sphingobacteriaceae bacterium]|nr:hypothetical protein CNR22_00200 [Sphingobacteriaceae bacterium]
MPKRIEQYPLLPLLRKFINELKKGKHLQKNGKRLKADSIANYIYLEALLTKFTLLHHHLLSTICYIYTTRSWRMSTRLFQFEVVNIETVS